MKVSREQVLENKRTILEAAGRLFRERGFESVTVADVMKSAGLTHGGFYGYFKSKDDLIAQALAEVLGRAATPPPELAVYAERYLSAAHRSNVAGGCPVAALAGDDAPARRRPRRDDRRAEGSDRTPQPHCAGGSGAQAPRRHRQLGGDGRRHDPRAHE